MDLELINTLSESRMFRTKQSLERYRDKTKDDLFYAYMLSTLALALDPRTSSWARKYAGTAAAFGNFDHFRTSQNDLYMLAHDVTRRTLNPNLSRNTIKVLRELNRGNVSKEFVSNYLLRTERILRISSSKLRNVRRTVMNWSAANEGQRDAALNTLQRFLRSESQGRAEILPFLGIATKGDPGHFGKPSALKKAAAIAGAGIAGAALGWSYDPNKRWSLFNR